MWMGKFFSVEQNYAYNSFCGFFFFWVGWNDAEFGIGWHLWHGAVMARWVAVLRFFLGSRADIVQILKPINWMHGGRPVYD